MIRKISKIERVDKKWIFLILDSSNNQISHREFDTYDNAVKGAKAIENRSKIKKNVSLHKDKYIKSKQLQKVGVEKLLEGHTIAELQRFYENNLGLYKETAILYAQRCNKEIKKFGQLELHTLLREHLELYEWLWRESLDVKDDSLSMDILAQKEKLLKLHGDEINIQINEFNEYDHTQLTQEQQIRLQQLLEKVKIR